MYTCNCFAAREIQHYGTCFYRKNNQLCNTSNRSGVIGWISGGIGRVVPQPETKYTEKKEQPDEEDTEVNLLTFS